MSIIATNSTFINPYIFTTWWFTTLLFQTKIIWSNRIPWLKYIRSTKLGCQDIGIKKSEFVTKTQTLSPSCTFFPPFSSLNFSPFYQSINHFFPINSFFIVDINNFCIAKTEEGQPSPKCIFTNTYFYLLSPTSDPLVKVNST